MMHDSDSRNLEERKTSLRAKIIERILRFGEDELLVVEMSTARLDAGRSEYGALDLDSDPRDWISELLEELVDANHYVMFETIRTRRRQKS